MLCSSTIQSLETPTAGEGSLLPSCRADDSLLSRSASGPCTRTLRMAPRCPSSVRTEDTPLLEAAPWLHCRVRVFRASAPSRTGWGSDPCLLRICPTDDTADLPPRRARVRAALLLLYTLSAAASPWCPSGKGGGGAAVGVRAGLFLATPRPAVANEG